MSSPVVAARWLVIIPVKATGRGKSRIVLPYGRRSALALAMALDTAEAAAHAASVRAVIAVVEDADDGLALAGLAGVTAHVAAAAGLNESVLEALGLLAARSGPVAVLPGDLPSLLPAELDGALEFSARHRLSAVADRQGSGTTLLAAAAARFLVPRYGPGSFAAHRAAGAAGVPVPAGSGLRRDVDVLADLPGVRGRRTRAVLAGLADIGAAAGPTAARGGTVET